MVPPRISHISLTMTIKGAVDLVADEAAAGGTRGTTTRAEVVGVADTKREADGEDTAPIVIITRIIIPQEAGMGIITKPILIWVGMVFPPHTTWDTAIVAMAVMP